MTAKIAAVLGIILIRFIVILESSFGVYSNIFQVAEYTGTTPTAIGWLSHCSIQSNRSSSLKHNTKLVFLINSYSRIHNFNHTRWYNHTPRV